MVTATAVKRRRIKLMEVFAMSIDMTEHTPQIQRDASIFEDESEPRQTS